MYLLINLTSSTIIPKWHLLTNSLRSWGCFWWRGTAGSSSPWVRPAPPANPTRSSGTRCTTRPSSAPTSRATATPTWATWTTFSRSWGLRGSPRRSVYPENERRCFAGPHEGREEPSDPLSEERGRTLKAELSPNLSQLRLAARDSSVRHLRSLCSYELMLV